jgi:hypothetical protein
VEPFTNDDEFGEESGGLHDGLGQRGGGCVGVEGEELLGAWGGGKFGFSGWEDGLE